MTSAPSNKEIAIRCTEPVEKTIKIPYGATRKQARQAILANITPTQSHLDLSQIMLVSASRGYRAYEIPSPSDTDTSDAETFDTDTDDTDDTDVEPIGSIDDNAIIHAFVPCEGRAAEPWQQALDNLRGEFETKLQQEREARCQSDARVVSLELSHRRLVSLQKYLFLIH
jgi:hypothetical protein